MKQDKRKAREERQEDLESQMKPAMEEAIKTVWKHPDKFSELLGVMEQFSRAPGQLGTGAENALLLYRKFGTRATHLVLSAATEENRWWKKKGSTAVNVYQYRSTAGKDFQTAVKAFDVSQLQEPSVAGTPPLDSPMPLKTMMDAMLQTAKGLNFVTERSSVLRGSGFVPAEDGKPARLILSKLLNQTEVRQESLYLYTLLHLSHGEGFSMNPETYFTARCAANILCKRYGGAPKELTAFPESMPPLRFDNVDDADIEFVA